jgi:hypothetical protein
MSPKPITCPDCGLDIRVLSDAKGSQVVYDINGSDAVGVSILAARPCASFGAKAQKWTTAQTTNSGECCAAPADSRYLFGLLGFGAVFWSWPGANFLASPGSFCCWPGALFLGLSVCPGAGLVVLWPGAVLDFPWACAIAGRPTSAAATASAAMRFIIVLLIF